MAILRGGKRIGNFDIRFGIPRDRSLDNVLGDPRLKRRPGGNPQTTINSFLAQISAGEGFARPSRFYTRFYLPKRYNLAGPGEQLIPANSYAPSGHTELTSNEMIRNVGVMCNQLSLPGRLTATDEHQIHGPSRQIATGYTFQGTIQCQFLMDKFLRQRMFFENWQKQIFDINTHEVQYYDNYVGTMDIYMLGQYAAEGDRDRITYAVRLYEVYPSSIDSGELMMIEGDFPYLQMPVTLQYRNCRNLTIDEVNKASYGKAYGDKPKLVPSKDFGKFSGILNRLPPEIRRAGRDVLGTIKRNIPIGKTTGGRVFPPFL